MLALRSSEGRLRGCATTDGGGEDHLEIRTQVRSPVNGFVTNLLMRVGDCTHQGTANISIIDTDSYWIDGYFEETKMARICVADRDQAKLIRYSQPILGHVATVTRGIGVRMPRPARRDCPMSTLSIPGSPWRSGCRFASRLTVCLQAFRLSPA